MGHNPVLAVTTFRSVKDPSGLQDYLDWETVSVLLLHHTVYPAKERGLLWSPTDYSNPDENQRVYRKAAAVRALSALVLDFDGGIPFSELPSGLRIFEWIVHTTWGHTGKHPKYRVVLPLRRAVPASDWKDFYAAVVPVLSGGNADQKCSDTSRIYYYPHHREGGKGFARRNAGNLLSSNDFHLEMVRLREARQQVMDYRADIPDDAAT